jgi:hypothetical protein
LSKGKKEILMAEYHLSPECVYDKEPGNMMVSDDGNIIGMVSKLYYNKEWSDNGFQFECSFNMITKELIILEVLVYMEGKVSYYKDGINLFKSNKIHVLDYEIEHDKEFPTIPETLHLKLNESLFETIEKQRHIFPHIIDPITYLVVIQNYCRTNFSKNVTRYK